MEDATRRREAVPSGHDSQGDSGGATVKDSARYAKVVEWSEEDQCYIGTAPGLFLGGCHGDDKKAVFDELCEIVDEVIAIYLQDGRELPPATSGKFSDASLQSAA